VLALSVVRTTAVVAGAALPAHASGYPTWSDVQQARHSASTKAAEQVAAGQNIASVGETGAATGCHLHFEVRIDEVAIDSVPFMAARGVTIG